MNVFEHDHKNTIVRCNYNMVAFNTTSNYNNVIYIKKKDKRMVV